MIRLARKTNVEINGKQYYRLRKTIGRDKDGKPIVKPFYGTSKSDAEAKWDKWRLQRAKGLKIDRETSLTQAMYIWLWNIEYVSGNKSSTFERYEGVYRNYIDGTELGYMLLNEINKLALQNYYSKLKVEGKTYSQIASCNKLLKKFFRYCLSEGFVSVNPCFGIKLDGYKENNELVIPDFVEDEEQIETYTPDEVSLIVNGDYNRKLKIMAKLALGTGLREGEILALEEKDIDLNNMEVIVTKTLTCRKVFTTPADYYYELVPTIPKTKSSIRKVPIPANLKKDLIEAKKIKIEEKLKLGDAYQDNNLIFPAATGGYMYARNFLRSWKRALKMLGIPDKKFHTLRDTYATQLVDKGVPIVTVSRLLGHSSLKTTEKYVKSLAKTKQKHVQVLNEML